MIRESAKLYRNLPQINGQLIKRLILKLIFISQILLISGASHSTSQSEWQFPLKIGDERSYVYTLLGNPSLDLGEQVQYAMSGIELVFSDDKISKIRFIAREKLLSFVPSQKPLIRFLKVDDSITKYLGALRDPYKVTHTRKGIELFHWKVGDMELQVAMETKKQTIGKPYNYGKIIYLELIPGHQFAI